MISRSPLSRILAGLVLAALCAAPSTAAPKPAPDPSGIVAALYADEQAGRSPLLEPGERAAKLTAGLAALWAKVEAAVPPGDEGPIDFDIVTNSQGAEVKSFTLKTDRRDATHAGVAATIDPGDWPRKSRRENVIRCDLTFDSAHWAIDDVHGVAEPRV